MAACTLAQQAQLTAVIYAADGVRFVAAAPCSTELVAKIVAYILGRCENALWPPVAARVRALMADDHPYAAIALYFAHVGERWDDERLEFGGLPVGRSQISGEGRQ
jgi:hypothetical protein